MMAPTPDHARSIGDHFGSGTARRIARIVAAYAAGSVAAFLFGGRLIDSFVDALSPLSNLSFTVLFCFLGPFATLSHALMGTGYGSITAYAC